MLLVMQVTAKVSQVDRYHGRHDAEAPFLPAKRGVRLCEALQGVIRNENRACPMWLSAPAYMTTASSAVASAHMRAKRAPIMNCAGGFLEQVIFTSLTVLRLHGFLERRDLHVSTRKVEIVQHRD